MLAGNGCLPSAQRSSGDSRPDVVHQRLGMVHRRLVSTLCCHDVLLIHDFYHGRVFRDLVLLGRAQLGKGSGSADIPTLPLQLALLFPRENCNTGNDWVGSSARRVSIDLAQYSPC